MKKQMLLIVVITTLLLSCSQNKKSIQSIQQQPNTYQIKVDSIFKSYQEKSEFMGSLALIHNQKTIYTNVIGFDDIEVKKKSGIHTKYRIGSVSKTFTAVLVFKAIEENKLTLSQTIESYFPNIKNADKITIAHLLQHRSGIHNFTRDPNFFTYHTQYKSSAEMLALISNYDIDFEPDSTGEYSNSNYFLLSQILEKTYDSSYEDLLKEKICIPLKLENTYTGKKINIADNECYSYKYTTEWIKLPETDMSITIGAGSIVSNPKEVNRFMEALFTGKLISIENLELMKTIKDNFGMGIIRYKINDRQGFGHRGTLDGYKSTAIYFPDEKLGITITSNASKDNINYLFTEVLKLYLNDPIIEISESEIQKYVGIYSNPEEKSDKYIFSNDKNILIHHIKEFRDTLKYKGNRRFVLEQVYAESMSFTFSPNGNELTIEQGDYKGNFVKE
ncbi:D-alanyl-D-alanine carboxypeptidase [Aquimarina sp. EL_43]|uniref:serine hydrolase domain-containing protein n=1 Tax=unclassified Aquimarina TaxID=2627091 RepID=UPI0018CB618E|nr:MULTISPECIES: serine hydrolase domain-containing protein [unclassified Aquimarina]MBG6132645.1 D-alanyl-D-alanine carboxypeptidase [Aquimarina sp. EL_35]MBG6152776.1 D-alanyl-D-alanine carboxypeptidase [Aquimarina sp. EL_32]MBG6170783.1 D-alanyl-D-alanine carboxypeptidase [Aquimarina sp. EL_43]